MGSLKAFFKCFIPAIPFPSWFFFMDKSMGNGVKLGPQGSRKYAQACHVFCVLLAGLQIDLFMVFVTDMALAVQTDKPRLAADEQGLTKPVPGLPGWTADVGCAAPQLVDNLCTSIQAVETAVTATVSLWSS